MTETLQNKLNSLIKSYSDYFDIRLDTDILGEHFSAEADFYSRSERYAMVKSAKIWGVETYEYVFISVLENLDMEKYESLKKAALETGLSRIRPHKEHMYTYVTLCIVAENIDADVRRAIAKTRFRKNYKLTFHGWMEFRVATRELSSGAIYHNNGGRALKKLLDNI